jgi:hypothetical protein
MVNYEDNCLYISNLKGERAISFEQIIKIKRNLNSFSSDWFGRYFFGFTLYYLDDDDRKRSAIFYIRDDNKPAWTGLQARLRLKFPALRVDDI